MIYGPEAGDKPPFATTIPAALTLVEVPARIAAAGIHTLEICHFHLASREAAYLGQVRDAIAAAEVELWSLLIDGGDLSHPADHARDAAWAEGWWYVAAQLGAKNARVSGGKQQPSSAAVALSEQNFAHLADAAHDCGHR
jgi:sugar phosphate isomerase/epimerase